MAQPSRQDLQIEVERLRRAERRKSEFLGQLAHEVGNVLVPLPLALEILKQPNLTPTTIERVREILEEQAVYIQRLIGQLRSVSRLTRGVDLDIRPAELQSLVRRAVATVQSSADERKHELVVTVPEQPLRMNADADRLEQALVHLLENAIRCTNPGGRIELETARADSEVVIRVADNGTGIAPELLPEIFEPFVRREGSIEWSEGRLGIGLSLVRQYVERHGGRVTAESAGPDQGSTFTVRLPLAAV